MHGILNGTGNFILDRMDRFGMDFDEALKEAQALGYAEADPTADIGGFDVANKAVISASVACGAPFKDDFPVLGHRESDEVLPRRFKTRRQNPSPHDAF